MIMNDKKRYTVCIRNKDTGKELFTNPYLQNWRAKKIQEQYQKYKIYETSILELNQ
jgi:hypothetical protein